MKLEKATLVGTPDADILAAAIEILRKRIAAGTATFLVKVKVHRGEPANEGADTLADKAISHQEITLVFICRIRMRLYVIKTLNDIHMSNNFELISLRRIIFYSTYICCIDIKRHIMLYNIYS